jgi:hypothetical protein
MGEIPLYFYFPMERFFDRTDQQNSKTQGRKGQIRKIQKTRWKEWRKEKEKIFTFARVLILMCSASVGNTKGYCPRATSLGRTHSYENLPYNFILSLVFQYCSSV